MTLRIMASGDHHFDEHSRFAECLRVHGWMVEQARERKIDLFLSAGDIYERASTPAERAAVAEWLTWMAEIAPVVIARGNHDRPQDVEIMRRLRTRYPITVEDRAAVHLAGGAAVATVAWPDRARLLAALGNQEATDQGIQEALRAVLRGLGAELDAHDGPRILLGHFMVDGSVTSTGQPLLGMPIRVGLEDLALARAHLTVMGHIHMFQQFDLVGAPALYTGSPFRTTFGQTEAKSVTLAEFDGAKLVSLEQLETPCTPMLHIEAQWRDGLLTMNDEKSSEDDVAFGAEIRLRYSVPADAREDARSQAARVREILLEKGAVSVKLEEEITVENRARVPEVAKMVTAADKLEAFWRAKGFEPGDRRGALIGKAQQLEEKAHAAA